MAIVSCDREALREAVLARFGFGGGGVATSNFSNTKDGLPSFCYAARWYFGRVVAEILLPRGRALSSGC